MLKIKVIILRLVEELKIAINSFIQYVRHRHNIIKIKRVGSEMNKYIEANGRAYSGGAITPNYQRVINKVEVRYIDVPVEEDLIY